MCSVNFRRYWQWQGVDDSGQRQRGVVAAANRSQAEMHVRQLGITPLRLKRFLTIGTPHCSAPVLTQWLKQLQQLLCAGISLPHALRVMAQATSSPCVLLLTQQVHHTLAQGDSFSAALKRAPYASLPSIELALLATAEQQSVLPHGIQQLAERRQRQHDWQRRCRQQLRYPLTLIVAGLGTAALMMKMVVPRFAQLYQQSGHPLPLLTRGLIRLTHTLTASAWPYVLLGIVFAAVWHWRHHPRAVYVIAHLPVLATLHRQQLGISLVEQLLLTRQLRSGSPAPATYSSRHPLEILISQLHQALATGAPLSQVLSSCRSGSRPLFAKDIVHLLRIAEHTGQMDDVLKQANHLLEQRSERYRQALTAWLEPILLSCLGLVIGTLMLSLYLPILDMKDVMI